MSQDLIMDSNAQERERGITILAKNTAVSYKDIKINIIDTPGHADFGGEVERTLGMADGVLLVVDAQEGPMPQTKFVLKKALELNKKTITVINKIDKPNSRVPYTLSKVYDLFLELATKEDQLEFPVIYASGRSGKAWLELPENIDDPANFTPIFESIINHIPAPESNNDADFQMQVTALDWDSYKGKYIIGRIICGKVTPGLNVSLIKSDGTITKGVIEKVFVNQGLKRAEASEGVSGDIVALTGIKTAEIGDTITTSANPVAMPPIKIEEPTLSITIGPNTSPFMGKEGNLLTGRQILERIKQELQTNVAMKLEINPEGKYVLSGRGELHLSVFLETLRREGFELEVSKPTVIKRIEGGKVTEPVEELTVDVSNDYVGAIKSEIGKRRGVLTNQENTSDQSTRLTFEISTRGIIGLRSVLLTLSRGTAVANSIFIRNEPVGQDLPKNRKGVVIASGDGKAVPYGLVVAHDKGNVFIEPQTMVYKGMIIGTNGREEDIEVNICKEKQLTNNRSVGEEGISLPPATNLSLEHYLSFLEDDELLEITPTSLRLRKKILDPNLRRKAGRK